MRRAALVLLAGLTACAGDDMEPGDAGAMDQGSGDDDDNDDDGETGEPPAALGDRCEDTVLQIEAPTRLVASLRHASPDPDGIAASCGLTGPVVFAEVRVRGRVDLSASARGRGFSPKLAILRPGCSADPSRVLACAETLPATLDDVGPQLDLLVAIAIDPDDPALASAPNPGEPDPLEFELRLDARPVLGEHDRCAPGLGRCEAGTLCLAADEDGVLVDRCWRPPADSCVNPGTLVVPAPGAIAWLEIPASEAHSDAHEHACTGWRRPERVERLVLPAELAQTSTLQITADDPRVGLALRGPDCLPEQALACAPATAVGDATSLSFTGPQLAALAAAGQAPLLFIELPSPADPDPPATVLVAVELID